MASTYTDRLRLELQGNGENPNSWGAILNQNTIDLLDTAVAGYQIVSVSSVGVSLTTQNGSADTSRSFGLRFDGTLTAAVTVTIPQKEKIYFLYNNTSGSFGITVKTPSGTAVSVVSSGSGMMVACDSININKFGGVETDISVNSITASIGTFNRVVTSTVSATSAVFSGIVSAASYAGSGAALTNVSAVFAASATNASFAISATNATNATFATSATNASFAVSATNATNLTGSVPVPALGAVGAVGLFRVIGNAAYAPGATIAGSNLRYTGFYASSANTARINTTGTTTPSGTWMSLSDIPATTCCDDYGTGIFIRTV